MLDLDLPSFFEAIKQMERWAAYLRGKGYGTATISQEVALALQLMDSLVGLSVDIGAHKGEYTLELLSHNRQQEIHMFEPSAENFAKLKALYAPLSNVVVNPVAISNTNGEADFYSNASGSPLSCLAKRRLDHFDIPFEHVEKVTTMRFEDYWKKRLNSRKMDIAKLDVEGFELAALEGFGEALEATKVVQFEFGGCNIDTRTYFRDFWYMLTDKGFEMYRITPVGLEKITAYSEHEEFYSTTNYLARNTRFVTP